MAAVAVFFSSSHALAISPEIPAILIEASTGQVLAQSSADRPVEVLSLGQLMVVLLSMEQANLGVLPLDVPITIDPSVARAASAAGRIALRHDRTYQLSELIKAILVNSADEAAIAVGEAISGTVDNCIEAMNARAARLRMTHTRFVSLARTPKSPATGSTTARDVAQMARALVADDNVLRWASVGGIPFDEANTVLRNRNRLVGVFPGADGLGTVEEKGKYGIIATAVRDHLRLIAVVFEAPSSDLRYQVATELLEWGFAGYERLDVIRRGERLNVSVRVQNGASDYVTPVAGASFSLIQARRQASDLVLRYQVPSQVDAPLARDESVGEVIIHQEGRLIGVVPAVVPSDIGVRGFLTAAGR
jgi:D-alanyl-D-alanine carboxypeptidase (penicillin-binding protein 5/6)